MPGIYIERGVPPGISVVACISPPIENTAPDMASEAGLVSMVRTSSPASLYTPSVIKYGKGGMVAVIVGVDVTVYVWVNVGVWVRVGVAVSVDVDVNVSVLVLV